MHLTDEQVQRFVDGQIPVADRRVLEQHIAPCGECRDRLTFAKRETEEVLGRLLAVDHPVPAVDAKMLIGLARRRRPRPGFGRWAAAVLLTFGLAGVAYATPGSPLPRWIKTLSTWIRPESDQPANPVESHPTPAPASAGISLVPGEKLAILFQLGGSGGSARVSLTDGGEVVVRAGSGAAGFTAGDDQLVVVARGDTASFEVEIPRSAPRVEILVGGHRVLLKAGDRITTAAPSDPDGSYRLSLIP